MSVNDVEFIYLEVSVAFSVDASCSRLFMSYFVGCFQSLGVWQQLSRLSLLSFGVSNSVSLSSPVLVKMYFPCLFMFILYGLQLIPISLFPRTLLSSVELMMNYFGEAVFSLYLHVDFVWFAIYYYLYCSLYSFMCGWLFSMMYLICKCPVILLGLKKTI